MERDFSEVYEGRPRLSRASPSIRLKLALSAPATDGLLVGLGDCHRVSHAQAALVHDEGVGKPQ